MFVWPARRLWHQDSILLERKRLRFARRNAGRVFTVIAACLARGPAPVWQAAHLHDVAQAFAHQIDAIAGLDARAGRGTFTV